MKAYQSRLFTGAKVKIADMFYWGRQKAFLGIYEKTPGTLTDFLFGDKENSIFFVSGSNFEMKNI